MKPTETLRDEHEIILAVVDRAEREAESIRRKGKANARTMRKMVDFFRNFVDRCHHGKEERHLFIRLVRRGMSAERGPIRVMLAEHEEGRKRVRALSALLPKLEAGDGRASKEAAALLGEYAVVLRAHIEKENEILFVMADRLLHPEDQTVLEAAFDRVEIEEIGEDVYERYREQAHQLAGHAAVHSR